MNEAINRSRLDHLHLPPAALRPEDQVLDGVRPPLDRPERDEGIRVVQDRCISVNKVGVVRTRVREFDVVEA
jgi:hypothetical protein